MKQTILYGVLMTLFVAMWSCHETKPVEPTPPTPLPNDSTSINPIDSIAEVKLDSSSVYIVLFQDSVAITNPRPDEIAINETPFGLEIVSEVPDMTYAFSGSCRDRSVKLVSQQKVQILFDSLDISATDGGGCTGTLFELDVPNAVVSVKEGSYGTLTDSRLTISSVRASLFSTGCVQFAGKGLLTIASEAFHAISTRGYVAVQSGEYQLSAGRDGIHCFDFAQLGAANLTIQAGDDGIQTENGNITIDGATLKVVSVDDALTADSISPSDQLAYIAIKSGDVQLEVTGEKAAGLDAHANIYLEGGRLSIQALQSATAAKAIKSKQHVLLSGGEVSIEVQGDAMYDPQMLDVSHPAGIRCEGYFCLSGSDTRLTMKLHGQSARGINASHYIYLEDGRLDIAIEGGAFLYGNTSSAGKALKCGDYFMMDNGSLVVKATGEGCEGIDSNNHAFFNGGSCCIEADDDAIKATNNLTIKNGEVYAYSLTNDGLDAKAGIQIGGGLVVAVGSPLAKKGGFETDGALKITGGTVLAVGNKNSKPSTQSSQYAISYTNYGLKKGDAFSIATADNSLLMHYVLPADYSTMHLIYSCPQFVKSGSYSLYRNQSVNGGETWHGFTMGGTASEGTLIKSFTLGSLLTTL